VNSYAYCLGDPVNNSDPSGHFILPSRVKALVSGWVGKARANLSLPVGGRISREYFVSPAAIENLGIATMDQHVSTAGTSNRLRSYSTRYADTPNIVLHNYTSNLHSRRLVYPTRNQRQFDATSGSELDAIFRNPRHPQHEAVLGVYQQNSEINIRNLLSVPSPSTSNVSPSIDPDRVLARIDSGLTGNVPGVMPSMLIHRIRTGRINPLTDVQLRQRYLQFFNRNARREG
jgi:hypothetical protein